MNLVDKVITEKPIKFVEPNEKGDYKRELFDISDEEAKQLFEQVVQVGEEIVGLEFWNKTCDDKSCEYCRLRKFIN